MSVEIVHTLPLLGLALSFFLVALIIGSKSFRTDVHLYFATAIVSLNMLLIVALFDEQMPENGVIELISWDFLFPFAFVLYVLKAIKDPLGNQKWLGLLATPAVLLSAFQIIDFLFDFDVYAWLVSDDQEQLGILIEAKSWFFFLFSILLLGLADLKVRQAKIRYKKARVWLRLNTLFLLTFFILWLLGDQISAAFYIPFYDLLVVLLAVFLMVIAYLGIHQLNIAEQRRQISDLKVGSITDDGESKVISTKPKQSESKITHKANGKIDTLLQLLTDEKIYLDPDLTRNALAKKLTLSEGYLSELLATQLQTNFNQLVNGYRVKHAINMLQDSRFDIFTLEAIGMESGFKTKSVFYHAFKKVTGTSPGNYRKDLKTS